MKDTLEAHLEGDDIRVGWVVMVVDFICNVFGDFVIVFNEVFYEGNNIFSSLCRKILFFIVFFFK